MNNHQKWMEEKSKLKQRRLLRLGAAEERGLVPIRTSEANTLQNSFLQYDVFHLLCGLELEFTAVMISEYEGEYFVDFETVSSITPQRPQSGDFTKPVNYNVRVWRDAKKKSDRNRTFTYNTPVFINAQLAGILRMHGFIKSRNQSAKET